MDTHYLMEIKTRNDLGAYLAQRGMVGAFAEIGVLFGEYSEFFLGTWPGKMFLVDPWENQNPSVYLDGTNSVRMDRAFEKVKALAALHASRVELLRMYSEAAAEKFEAESLDGCHIDGNHAYAYAKQDCELWWPKIKKGGIMSGHDFYEAHTEYQDCGVKSAVSDFARENRLMVHLTPCTSWFILKP